MKVKVLGAGGQLGYDIVQSAPAQYDVVAFGKADCDISSQDQCRIVIEQEKPDVIINAAAYTAVDAAESNRELAFAVNEIGVAHLAALVKQYGVRIIHVSTDFVFDGEKALPYLPSDTTHPINVYGESKLAGERRLLEVCPEQSIIIRTSWLYGAHGNNFVKTMLRLAKERDEMSVVADQMGAPTWAKQLADVIWTFVGMGDVSGVYHFSNAGEATWYDFAIEIMGVAKQVGLLDRVATLTPIETKDYPTPARRPRYSVLDKSALIEAVGVPVMAWQDALGEMLVSYADLLEREKENV